MLSPIIIQNLMRNNYNDEMEEEEMSKLSWVRTISSSSIESLIELVNKKVNDCNIYSDISFMYDDKTGKYVAFLIGKNRS